MLHGGGHRGTVQRDVWKIQQEGIVCLGASDCSGRRRRGYGSPYTMSLNEKAALRQRLEGWRGRVFTPAELEGFDLGKVLGQPCLLNIIQAQKKDGTPYSKINGVSRLPKSMPVPQASSPLILFDLDDPDALNKMSQLPEWVQGRIKASETYKASLNPPPQVSHCDIDTDEDGDLPF